MRHSRVGIAVAIACSLAAVAAQGFRGNPWGSSTAYVKTHESFSLIKDEPYSLWFTGQVAGFDSAAWYEFIPGNDELAQAGYAFLQDHSNPNLYIDDYHKLQDILTSKYGTPDVDTIDWKDDLYKGDQANYGMGVAMGHMVFITKWTTTTEDIGLVLSGDNADVSLGMLYRSHRYYPELEAAQNSEDQSAF